MTRTLLTAPRDLHARPRKGVHGPRPDRRPRLTGLGRALAFATVVAMLVGGVVVAIVRAEEPEPERFTPVSRGPRAAVLERFEVVDLAAEVFGAELAPYVARIAFCESSHRPGARNAGWDRVFGSYDYRGLLQVSTMWAPLALELTGSDDLYDPLVNLIVGRAIQQSQGWRAWPYCSR